MHPQLPDRHMADFANATATANALRRRGARMHLDGQPSAKVERNALETEALTRALDNPRELGLAGARRGRLR